MNLIEYYNSRNSHVDEFIEGKVSDAKVRNELYKLIPNDPPKNLHELIKALFKQEMLFREAIWEDEEDDPYDFFENIYLCAFLLYRIGDPSDVYILWEAKYLNMDVGGTLDGNYFLGAGSQETINYLESKADKGSKEILEYIRSYAEDQEEHEDWPNYILNYHGRNP